MERRQNEGSNIHKSRQSGSGYNSASERGADGQSRGVLGDGLKRADCVGNDIPSLQEFLQEIRGYDRHFNLTLIDRQFCSNLALANHTPHEVMRVSAIFAQKK